MSQQPYAPQFPVAPQQGYGQQYPPQQMPPPPVQPQYQQPVPQQAYGQQPPQVPAQPLAQGSLDDYYSQPTAGGGPSISWSANGMQKPLGTTYAGIVARDVANGDVQQDTDPKTGAGKFYRDGRPRWVMKVPLKMQPTQEFPEGEASWYVRGQARDELTRAMNAAGLVGNVSPKEGDVIQVTLVERRPSRGGGMPANIVQVTFQPGPRHQPGTQVGAAPAQAPVTEAASPASVPAIPHAPAPVAAPNPGVAAFAPGTPGTPQQPAPDFAQQQVQAYAQQPAPVQPQAPVAQQLQPPAGLDPAQQELLARLTQGQQPA